LWVPAFALSLDRSDLVRSVILLAGVGLIAPEPEVVRALQAWFGQDTTEADCLEATKQLVADPAAAHEVFRQVKRWPAAAAARRAADRATPQDDWMEPPNQVPDAGHLVFLEQPELVAEAVISFLRRQTL